jgi:WbqC-like protein
MKIAIMQPYFFPYLGYFQLIHAVNTFVLYGEVNHIKRGWISRNRILWPNGEPAYISAEIKNRSSHRKISEVAFVQASQWRRKLLRTIMYNYRKSPYFNEVFALVADSVNNETQYLSELNKRSIVSICDFLGIRTTIETDERRYAPLEERLSKPEGELGLEFPELRLTVYRRKVIRILGICRQEGAEVFVNAIGGQPIYDKGEFQRNGVQLCFLKTQPYAYPQRGSPFVPDLSIIDVLMNCGKEGTRELLVKYSLV